jgi:hypothetical protein
MNEEKKIKNMERMNKDQMLELLRIVEIIEKKNIDEIIQNFYNNSKNYLNIEKELIENKINMIKSKNIKYKNIEKYENVKIYSYEKEIQIYHKTDINTTMIKEKIEQNPEKNIFIKEKNKIKKIKKEDIDKINKDFEIVLKNA